MRTTHVSCSILLIFILGIESPTTSMPIMEIFQLLSGLPQVLDQLGGLDNVIHKASSLLAPIQNVSKICEDNLKLAATGFLKSAIALTTNGSRPMDNWEFKLIDAFGKPGDGMFSLNFQWLGNFKECMDIGLETSKLDAHPAMMASLGLDETYHSPPLPPFHGEYCLVQLTPQYQKNSPNEKLPIREGTCFPSTCSMQDKIAILSHYLQILPMDIDVNKDFCQSNAYPRSMDNLTIAITSILSTVLFITVLATLVDLILFRRSSTNLENSNNSVGSTTITRRFVHSFSLIENVQKLCNEDAKHPLSHLSGFQFIAVIWTFLGHSFLILNYNVISYANRMDYILTYEDFGYQLVFTSRFAFDWLFQLMSFKVCCQLLHYFQEQGPIGVIAVLQRRISRLLPTYLAVVAFMLGPVTHTGDGPLWPRQIISSNQCRNSWWTLLLFAYNVNQDPTQCNPTFWYPSVDAQLFVLVPLVFYPIYKFPRFGFIAIGLYWVTSMVSWILVVYLNDIIVVPSVPLTVQNLNTTISNFDDIYMQPWGHLPPLLTGAALAYVFKLNTALIDFVRKRPWIKLTGWCVSIAIILSLTFGTYPLVSSTVPQNKTINVFYGCLTSHLWSIASAWLILAVSIKGHLGGVRALLRWRPFRLLGRISYYAYLVHFMVITHHFYSTKVILHFDGYNKSILYVLVVIVSFGAALILTLTVEMPVLNLIEICLPKLNKSNRYQQLQSDENSLKRCRMKKL